MTPPNPRDLEEYLDWDDFDGMPSWSGPTHARPIGFARPTSGPLARAPIQYRPLCEHWRRPVELCEGLNVYASAWRDRPVGRLDTDWADIGFYLDSSWASTLLLCSPGFQPSFVSKSRINVALYPWPDFGEPVDRRRFGRAVRWLLSQARNGRRIEIGCLGGHGRTGTTIASMLVLQGMDPDRAIERVRRRYCTEAIETREQELLIVSLDPKSPKNPPKRPQRDERRRGQRSSAANARTLPKGKR